LPYYNINVDNEISEIYGGDYDVLTVGLIFLPDYKFPVLQCGGYLKESNENSQWLNWLLTNTCNVRINISDDIPTQKTHLNNKLFSEKVDRKSEGQRNNNIFVSVDEKQLLSASSSNNLTLQTTLTWSKSAGLHTIEVGCTDNNEKLNTWFSTSVNTSSTVEISIGKSILD